MKLAEYTKLTLPQRALVDQIQRGPKLFTNGNDKGVVRTLSRKGFVEYDPIILSKELETRTGDTGYWTSLL